MRKVLVMLLLVLVFVFSAGTAHATHYVTGRTAVDGREIRWGGSTTYLTQWNAGISTWNALGKINIAPDTIWTWEDLTVSDVNRPREPWVGQYLVRIGADALQLNTALLGSHTNAERQMTTTHELGHTLGLGHSTEGNIMYTYISAQTSLGPQDRNDYGYLWGY